MPDRIERVARLAGVFNCPKHGQVWRYLGPEPYDCAYCLNDDASAGDDGDLNP